MFDVKHIDLMFIPWQVSWRAAEKASEEEKCVYCPHFRVCRLKLAKTHSIIGH